MLGGKNRGNEGQDGRCALSRELCVKPAFPGQRSLAPPRTGVFSVPLPGWQTQLDVTSSAFIPKAELKSLETLNIEFGDTLTTVPDSR